MKKQETHIPELFTISGCLTAVTLQKYAHGLLKGESLDAVRAHLSTCELCAEAAEGVKLFDNESPMFSMKSSLLNERISAEVFKGKPVRNLRPVYAWASVAAILLLFVGLYFLIIEKPDISSPLALEKANNKAAPAIEKLKENNSAKDEAQRVTAPSDVSKETKSNFEKKAEVVNISMDEDVKDSKQSAIDAVADLTDLEAQNRETLSYKTPAKPDSNKNKPEGNSKTAQEEQAVTAEPVYVDGITVQKRDTKRVSLDKDQSYEKAFTVVEEMPEFPGGEQKMVQFITENLRYPELAKENGIQGSVYLNFEVNASGKIENIKVLRGIGGGLDEEAVRVVKLMPRWKPGKQNGKAVSVNFNLPIKFSLKK